MLFYQRRDEQGLCRVRGCRKKATLAGYCQDHGDDCREMGRRPALLRECDNCCNPVSFYSDKCVECDENQGGPIYSVSIRKKILEVLGEEAPAEAGETTDAAASKEEGKMSFKDKLINEGELAGYLSVSGKFTDLSRARLIARLQGAGVDSGLVAQLAAALESPLGAILYEGLAATLLSMAAPRLGPNAEKVASALRIRAMMHGSDTLFDLLAEPFFEATRGMPEALPAGREGFSALPKEEPAKEAAPAPARARARRAR